MTRETTACAERDQFETIRPCRRRRPHEHTHCLLDEPADRGTRLSGTLLQLREEPIVQRDCRTRDARSCQYRINWSAVRSPDWRRVGLRHPSTIRIRMDAEWPQQPGHPSQGARSMSPAIRLGLRVIGYYAVLESLLPTAQQRAEGAGSSDIAQVDDDI